MNDRYRKNAEHAPYVKSERTSCTVAKQSHMQKYEYCDLQSASLGMKKKHRKKSVRSL